MGEKKHINKIAPKIPGQSCENFIYVFCSLCVFFAPYKKGSGPPPPYTREMGTICPFGVCFPCFIVLVASQLAIFPLKRSVLGARKGHSRARKGQMVNSGFQDPKTTCNAFKTREDITTPQLASLHGLPLNWAKKCFKTGEKNTKRTNGTYFARRPPPHL